MCESVRRCVCLRGAVVSHVRVCSQSCKHIEPCSVSVGVREKLSSVYVCVRACVVSHVSTFNHDVMPLCCVCVCVCVGCSCSVVVEMDGGSLGHY